MDIYFENVMRSMTVCGTLNSSDLPYKSGVLVRALSEKSGVDERAVLVSVLSALSVSFGGACDVEGVTGESMPLSIFGLVSLASGGGKSTLAKIVFGPIRRYQNRVDDVQKVAQKHYDDDYRKWKRKLFRLEDRLITAEIDYSLDIGLIRRELSSHKNLEPVKPRFVRLIRSDTTKAGLANVLANSMPTGILLNPDASDQLSSEFFENSTMLCSLWSGERIDIERAYKITSINSPRFSACLMTQPKFLVNLFNDEGNLNDNGLLARFVVAAVTTGSQNRRACDPERERQIDEIISDYSDFIEKSLQNNYGNGNIYPEFRQMIRLSEDSKSFLRRWYQDSIRRSEPGGDLYSVRNSARKGVEQATRIAALLMLFEDPYAREAPLKITEFSVRLIFDGFLPHLQHLMRQKETFIEAEKALKFQEYIAKLFSRGQIYYSAFYPGCLEMRYPAMHTLPNALRKKHDFHAALNFLSINRKIVLESRGYIKRNGTPGVQNFIVIIDNSPVTFSPPEI